MATHVIDFTGKTRGAIGRFCTFRETVEAETFQEAVLSLYSRYEHVHHPTIHVPGPTYEEMREAEAAYLREIKRRASHV